jgi:hypothetical protein
VIGVEPVVPVVDAVKRLPTDAVPVMVTAATGATAPTGPTAALFAVEVPAELVAVTLTRKKREASVEVTVYVADRAPVMLEYVPLIVEARCQR